MLTAIERVAFVVLTLASLSAAGIGYHSAPCSEVQPAPRLGLARLEAAYTKDHQQWRQKLGIK